MRDCIQVTLHAIGHARRVEQRLESEGVWEVLPWEMDVDGKREREREDTQGRARKDDKMLLDRFPGHIARPQVSQRTSVIVSTTYFLGNRRRGKVEREGMRLVRR